MKANAPEKLYITNDEKRFGDKCHSASTEKYVDDDIEHVRTDAFIKKASEWFKIRYEWIDIDGTRNYDMSTFEDFRNYMEGE